MERADIPFMKLPSLENIKKVLCVQPHFDDNEIGAGGWISKMHQKGIEIVYITITHGSLGVHGDNLTREEKGKIRRKEQEKNIKILGVKNHYMLNYEDQGDYSVRELEHELIRLFRKEKPDIVLTCDPYLRYESHTDHVKVGRAVLQAVLSSGLSGYPSREDKNVHAIDGALLYYTDKPNTYIDITDTYELKKELILNHESQVNEEGFRRIEEYLDAQAIAYGKRINVRYAEGFSLVPLQGLHGITDEFLE